MNDEDKGLEHTLAHIILSMRATDSEQFAKLCELLDVDP
jgi:hypothetical protein